MSSVVLTHRLLDGLLEEYRNGAMLDGTEEHENFVVSVIECLPALIEAARKTIPGDELLSVRIPQLVPPSVNHVEHWSKRSSRRRKEAHATMLVLSQFTAPKPPVTVTLVRCAGGQLDDDNATGSMKAVRDEVARWLGVDDGDASVRWRVEQRRVATKDRGTIVRVEVLR